MPKILVVDDVPDNVKLLTHELWDEWHSIRVTLYSLPGWWL
ncbi:hypothetical protein Pla8534_37640 [Lignipirellula cremea]|uniref:Uncharacterized protein n=1 Tax=Lignipirellula cremea TaxID=2528010 RepID=A0A518DVT0_9BACT|nr:hypothetical protein Pla8534_37640 [Lignipirellula cremea]